MQNKGAKAYLTAQINDVSQGELLLMLYDAAIKFLYRAKIKILEKDVVAKGNYISQAIDVIGELSSCLNKETGGEITVNLARLYFFCNTHLVKANIHSDKKRIDEVIEILKSLRSSYAEIIPSYQGRPLSKILSKSPEFTEETLSADFLEKKEVDVNAFKKVPQAPSVSADKYFQVNMNVQTMKVKAQSAYGK